MTLTCPHCGKPIDYELKLLRSFNFNRVRSKLPKGKMQSTIARPEFVQGDTESPLDSRVIIPGARAGIIGGVALPFVWWALGWPVGPVVTAAGTLLLFAWMSKAPKMIIEDDDEPEPIELQEYVIKFEQINPQTKQMKFFETTGITPVEVMEVARAWVNYRSISEEQLTPRKAGKPFGSSRYRSIMRELQGAGIIEYVDPSSPQQGRKPTLAGNSLLTHYAQGDFNR